MGRPEVGDAIFPISRFMITLARRGFDIFLAWYVNWCVFVSTYCSVGFSGLERGGRVGRLHVQSTIEIQCPMDDAGVKLLRKFIRRKTPIPT